MMKSLRMTIRAHHPIRGTPLTPGNPPFFPLLLELRCYRQTTHGATATKEAEHHLLDVTHLLLSTGELSYISWKFETYVG